MGSYLAHLIEDPVAPVTREWAAKVEAFKRTVPHRIRAARKAELAAMYLVTTKPQPPRAGQGKGVVNEGLAAWWLGTPAGPVTVEIRRAAKEFPDMDKADFVATMVSLGINPSTAAIQFVKGRKE